MSEITLLVQQVSMLLNKLDQILPPAPSLPNFTAYNAFRWVVHGQHRYIATIKQPHYIAFDQIKGVDTQKASIYQNTQQFVNGFHANNVLLWGSRGTGKSSLIKACLHEFKAKGLRVVEIEKHDLATLPVLLELLQDQPFYFILFLDDLSFDASESTYKSLKALLDGSLGAPPSNVLIYASSNRRHLVPEYHHDNAGSTINEQGELHHSEVIEEKISLSERFGLWLSFYPFTQSQYLDIVAEWLMALGQHSLTEEVRSEALRFAIGRGSRSGRVAYQFAKEHVGKRQLDTLQSDPRK